MGKELLFHSAKGGVGKSTLSILAAEYFLSQGYSVDLTDASGNPTASKWIQKCLEQGRAKSEFTSKDPDILIRDTKGIPDSALPFFAGADLIVIPFQPFSEDVEESEEVFEGLPESDRGKVVFIPNRLRALGMTREQFAAVEEIKDFINEMGCGTLLPGLIERIAVYPLILNGLPKNFFSLEFKAGSSQAKAQAECREVFDLLAKLLGGIGHGG